MKTKAAVLEATSEPLRVCELETPPLDPGQVLVQMDWSGVCQSQLNEWRGRKGPDRYIPHTLGHEGAGTVLEVGAEVRHVKPGDSVVLTWLKGPGADAPGPQYQRAEGAVNSGPISTFLQHTVVSENRLVRVEGMPPDVMALLGCAVPTGCGIVLNTLRPVPKSSMAIWGIGGIGASAVMAAAALDCDPIVAVDIVPTKRELAQALGATHALPGDQATPGHIRDLTGGQGVDFAVEATGRTDCMEAAYSAVRANGGRCVIAGNAPQGEFMRVNPFDLICGKRLEGSWGGQTTPAEDIPKYAEWYRDGRLPLDKLITHRLPLERINEAFELLESGDACRVLIDMKA